MPDVLFDARGQRLEARDRPDSGGNGSGSLSFEQVRELVETILEETTAAGLTTGDLSIIRDEFGWDRLGAAAGDWGISESERQSIIRRARLYSTRDAACRQLIRLWTNFGIHLGVQVRANTDPAKQVERRFWRGRANRSVFSYWGQRRSSDGLLVDGEIAFAVGWADAPDGLKVRRLDPLQITDVVTDPEDAGTVWYYKREFLIGTNDRRQYAYRDLYAPDDIADPGSIKSLEGCQYQDDAVVYWVPWDLLGKRGNSLLTTVLDWSKAHRKFMEARAAIERALARFAWRHKIKGGAAAVASRVAELQSSLVTGNRETNPPAAPASDWVENLGYSLDPIKVDTGAGNAQIDGSMLIMMVGLGAGVFPQYLGAGESFRLATATAMESPMLKQFESYQQLWKTIYKELLDYALEEDPSVRGEERSPGIVEEEPGAFEVEVPPILNRDVPRTIAALAKMFMQMPELAEDDTVRQWILRMIGLEDPKAIVEAVRKEMKKAERKRAETPPPPPPPPPGEPPPGAPAQQQAITQAIEAMRGLADVL